MKSKSKPFSTVIGGQSVPSEAVRFRNMVLYITHKLKYSNKMKKQNTGSQINSFQKLIHQNHLSNLGKNQFEIVDVKYDQTDNLICFGLVFPTKENALKAMHLINESTAETDGIEYNYIMGKHALIFFFSGLRELKNEHKILENTANKFHYRAVIKITDSVKIWLGEIHENCLYESNNKSIIFHNKFMYASIVVKK